MRHDRMSRYSGSSILRRDVRGSKEKRRVSARSLARAHSRFGAFHHRAISRLQPPPPQGELPGSLRETRRAASRTSKAGKRAWIYDTPKLCLPCTCVDVVSRCSSQRGNHPLAETSHRASCWRSSSLMRFAVTSSCSPCVASSSWRTSGRSSSRSLDHGMPMSFSGRPAHGDNSSQHSSLASCSSNRPVTREFRCPRGGNPGTNSILTDNRSKRIWRNVCETTPGAIASAWCTRAVHGKPLNVSPPRAYGITHRHRCAPCAMGAAHGLSSPIRVQISLSEIFSVIRRHASDQSTPPSIKPRLASERASRPREACNSSGHWRIKLIPRPRFNSVSSSGIFSMNEYRWQRSLLQPRAPCWVYRRLSSSLFCARESLLKRDSLLTRGTITQDGPFLSDSSVCLLSLWK